MTIIDKNHRKHAERIPYETADGVRKLLSQAYRLHAGRFERGDFSASDILIDLATAIERAGLDDRERRIIYDYLIMGDHYTAICKRYEIDHSTLYRTTKAACEKIAEVYAKWNYSKT